MPTRCRWPSQSRPAAPAPVVPVRAAEAFVLVVRAKGIAPDLAAPVRADSRTPRGNLLATHWQQYSMQMAMVSFQLMN